LESCIIIDTEMLRSTKAKRGKTSILARVKASAKKIRIRRLNKSAIRNAKTVVNRIERVCGERDIGKQTIEGIGHPTIPNLFKMALATELKINENTAKNLPGNWVLEK
jgi:hypothetical protein